MWLIITDHIYLCLALAETAVSSVTSRILELSILSCRSYVSCILNLFELFFS